VRSSQIRFPWVRGHCGCAVHGVHSHRGTLVQAGPESPSYLLFGPDHRTLKPTIRRCLWSATRNARKRGRSFSNDPPERTSSFLECLHQPAARVPIPLRNDRNNRSPIAVIDRKGPRPAAHTSHPTLSCSRSYPPRKPSSSRKCRCSLEPCASQSSLRDRDRSLHRSDPIDRRSLHPTS
jgi:hypothetical protein